MNPNATPFVSPLPINEDDGCVDSHIDICRVPGTRYCIGSVDSRDPQLLKTYNIGLIVVLMADEDLKEIMDPLGVIERCHRLVDDETVFIDQIIYKIRDLPGANILPIVTDLREVCDVFFGSGRAGNILFHCMSGISRSPSAVIGLLMHEGYTYFAALDLILTVREVEPDPGFAYQLATIDHRINKLYVG